MYDRRRLRIVRPWNTYPSHFLHASLRRPDQTCNLGCSLDRAHGRRRARHPQRLHHRFRLVLKTHFWNGCDPDDRKASSHVNTTPFLSDSSPRGLDLPLLPESSSRLNSKRWTRSSSSESAPHSGQARGYSGNGLPYTSSIRSSQPHWQHTNQ